ncbi:MAG: 1,4-beta-D-glucan glucohydrolase [Alphaproteobacteria bacterium MarineAlpha5_Bin11]|nr:MAG: 1,4-beta-D-glucan glucohydrolase [Alphaproteobacteria bacterium MarineAlpha5_Bin11]PPR51871.1 MAG: 1,4-beta-D-glucan glucohydrolase [Alphaproteobacteria bacterium MarineAlpha5_Bin10]|tara:strand:+ start:708 stop:2054 length:1347 start_codon:yes stop_codon:yes gene_type:complete
MKINFPSNFLWGTATSSYQIEGAANIDGKGKSIWDTFAHTPGNIKNNENADVAADHYRLFKDDVRLMAEINMHAYRFSIAWTRIFPEGRGTVNQKGLDFYSKLIDELLKNNIKPLVTLYHWDLPQKLQDKGGWLNRDTAKIFSDYAETFTKKFSDKIDFISTFNEPAVFSIHGNVDGYMAPGIKNKDIYLASLHHINLAHGYAIQSMRSIRKDLELGCVLNLGPCVPCSDSEEDINATNIYDMYWNRAFLNPMYKGYYPSALENELKKYIFSNDIKNIYQKCDYIGLNHYQHSRVKADKNHLLGARGAYYNEKPFGLSNDVELTSMGWEVVPEAYYDQIMELKNLYDDPIIYLTENGCAYLDKIENDGKVYDNKRVEYYKKYLSAVKKAIDDGANIKGYMVWSLMDNFEWALGFDKRFGLIHIDFYTLKRTPKNSYFFYKDLINNNGF